jgi:hypothetical protein
MEVIASKFIKIKNKQKGNRMGLDQRIIEVINTKKLKRIISSDLWTKYVDKNSFQSNDVINDLLGFLSENFSDTKVYNYLEMDPNENKMKKDGFKIVESFRKNSQLQGWFEKHYNIRNLQNIRLTKQIIDKLLLDIENKKLEVVEGILYGEEEMDMEDEEKLIETLKYVEKEIIENNKVFLYTCWY